MLPYANKKQTVTAVILLEKLCTEKEKRRHRLLAKNQVGTCGISERRFIQGDRPEAGVELAMTDRELAHLFLGVAFEAFISYDDHGVNFRSQFPGS